MTWPTFTAGNVLTAAQMTELAKHGNAWTAYTPSWTSTGTAPSIGNGTLEGAYILAGKLCLFRIRLVFGSTTSAGTNFYSLSLPATANLSNFAAVGQCAMRDDDANTTYAFTAALFSSTSVSAWNGSGNRVAATTPFTWANNDQLTISGAFETT